MSAVTLIEQFIQFLHKQNLKRRYPPTEVLGLRVSYMDLSPLRLRFSHRSPFIEVSKPELQQRSPDEIYATLRDIILQQQVHDRIPIILLEGHSVELRRLANEPPYYMAVLDEEEIRAIMNSYAPTEQLLSLLRCQVPLSFLSPYEVSAPVTGSQFFGRDYELKTILGHPKACYTIIGTRRIGKTSVLQEAKRRMGIADPNEKRYLYMDCMAFNSKEAFFDHVIGNLYPREYSRLLRIGLSYADHFGRFMQRMREMYGGKIVFFMDEADHLLQFDRPSGYELIKLLRACFQADACRFIFAGYREVQREFGEKDSPLNFTTPLNLSNLSHIQASDLISSPMNALGVKFVNRDQVIRRIFQETNGHPNYIQYYCSTLIRQLDETGNREIAPENLAKLGEDESFRTRVLETFVSNTNDLEKAVAYAVAERGQFTREDVDIQMKRHRIFLEGRELEDACRKLVSLGIVDQANQTYTFAVPVFPQLFRERYGGEFLFTKAYDYLKLKMR